MNEDEKLRRDSMAAAQAGVREQFGSGSASRGEIFGVTVRPWIGDGREIENRSSDGGTVKLDAIRSELIALADKILREAGAWPEMSKTASVGLTITHDTKWATV